MRMGFGLGYASTYVVFRVDESRVAGKFNQYRESIAGIKDECTRGEEEFRYAGIVVLV